MHKSKTTNKCYIGYTSLTIGERLHKHYTNAIAGEETHFYRAIRKYGIDDFVTKELWRGYNKNDATEMEKKFIDMYNTLEEGYNMTAGGDGGWCVPQEKYDEWVAARSMPRDRNGRWSGYSDEEILDCAFDYFNKFGYNIAQFIVYSSETYGMPKSYSKNRFNGRSFKEAYCERFNVPISMLKYKKTDRHKISLSKSNKGNCWYSNDSLKKSIQSKCNPGDGWYCGRKYGN